MLANTKGTAISANRDHYFFTKTICTYVRNIMNMSFPRSWVFKGGGAVVGSFVCVCVIIPKISLRNAN